MMLRIGKNPKDQEDNEQNERHDASAYSTPRNFAPTTSAETRAAVDAAPVTTKAMTESETLAREIKEGTLSGFVGGGTQLTGEATFKAMLRVDGHLSGKISSSSGTLIVGANGKVDANIEVAIAIIHGTVNGDIIASQRLELGRAAKVNGNIQTPSLVIEQGGIFEGSCKMVKMNAALDKDKRPLDTTGIKPVAADAPPSKPSDLPGLAAKSTDVTQGSKMAN